MPTDDQFAKACDQVLSRFPLARPVRLGPDGVTFEYPGSGNDGADVPFTAL